ncbi:unnamed protein product [Cuscuta epithymum]|uniref:Uncharacterized protein n=1 Tax=Cuscuta epithymum TaxID=186058 RepID=A0AAV0GB11_9ASTE|nr:unnamed protein product [Cuscuta epithymum]
MDDDQPKVVDHSQHHYHHHHHYYHHDQPGCHGSVNIQPKPKIYRVHCKVDSSYALADHEGTVILAPIDPTDPRQGWVRDDSLSIHIKDENGFPSFFLINKGSGRALKHPSGAGQRVELMRYDRGALLDGSMLWTAAGEEEYKAVRLQNNVRLNMDAFGCVKESGGVHGGTIIGVWEWNGGDNQRWKFVPY